MFWENLNKCWETGQACLNGAHGWFWGIIAVAAIILIFNFIVKRFLNLLANRFQKRGEVLKESFVTALHTPLSCYIWFFAVVEIGSFLVSQIYTTTDVTYKSLFLGLGLVLAVAWFLLRWKKNLFRYIQLNRNTLKRRFEPATIDVLDKLLTVLILFMVLFLSLEITGSSLNTLIAFGGIGGLAIAFASQDVIANFFGGLMTYITQPFVIGDWILLPEKNIEGNVEEIGWYMTKVRTFDKKPLYLPNSHFSKSVVINPSRMSHRRIKETIGIRYCDFPQLRAVLADIQQVLRENKDLVPDMAQGVYFTAFNSFSLDLELSAYTYETAGTGFNRIKENLLFAIGDIFAKHGVEFAFASQPVVASNAIKK